MDWWYTEMFDNYLGFWKENEESIRGHYQEIQELKRKVIR